MTLHGVHKTRQTAFRLPEGLLAWLKGQAQIEGTSMTEIVQRALEREAELTSPAVASGGNVEPLICPRPDHTGCWPGGAPPLDRYTDGSGRRSCPGVRPDGSACGYEWAPAGRGRAREVQR